MARRWLCRRRTCGDGAPDCSSSYQSSFDGPGRPTARSQRRSRSPSTRRPGRPVVDRATERRDPVRRAGNPVKFSATGFTSSPVAGGRVAVDNSGGATQGNIYVWRRRLGRRASARRGTLAGLALTRGKRDRSAVLGRGRPRRKPLARPIFGRIRTAAWRRPDRHRGWGLHAAHRLDGRIRQLARGFFHRRQRLRLVQRRLTRSTTASLIRSTCRADTRLTNRRRPSASSWTPGRDRPVDRRRLLSTAASGSRLPRSREPLRRKSHRFERRPGRFDAAGDLYVAEARRYPATAEAPGSTSSSAQPESRDPDQAAVRQRQVRRREPGFGRHGGGAPATRRTSYRVEYGPDHLYGSTQPTTVALDRLRRPYLTSVQVEGLTPDTTYHYPGRRRPTPAAPTTAPTAPSGPTRSGLRRSRPLPERPRPQADRRRRPARLPRLRARLRRNTGGYDVESTGRPGRPVRRLSATPTRRFSTGSTPGSFPGPGIRPTAAPTPTWRRGATTAGAPVRRAAGRHQPEIRTLLLDPRRSRLGPRRPSPSPGRTSVTRASPRLETGIPLRSPDGGLVQGMAGSLDPGAGANPRRRREGLSADGSHLVFGSTAARAGRQRQRRLTIYDRDLATGTTTSFPRARRADPMSRRRHRRARRLRRRLAGPRRPEAATDAAGNAYSASVHERRGSAELVDLTPGATAGVLYDGMTADGSRVFFTSARLCFRRTATPAPTSTKRVSAPAARSTCAWSRPRQLRPPATRSRTGPAPTGTRSPPPPTAERSRSAAGRGGQRERRPLLPQPRAARRRRGPEPAQPLPRGAGRRAEFVATLEPDNPIVVDSVAGAEATAGQPTSR